MSSIAVMTLSTTKEDVRMERLPEVLGHGLACLLAIASGIIGRTSVAVSKGRRGASRSGAP